MEVHELVMWTVSTSIASPLSLDRKAQISTKGFCKVYNIEITKVPNCAGCYQDLTLQISLSTWIVSFKHYNMFISTSQRRKQILTEETSCHHTLLGLQSTSISRIETPIKSGFKYFTNNTQTIEVTSHFS